MFKIIFLLLLLIAFIITILVLRQPDSFRYARTQTMNATPGAVFEQVNDLRKFNEWSPWAKVDPGAKIEFSGPSAGVGAAMSWDGNKDIGAGKMTVIDSKPNDYVKYRLDFERPMKSTAESEISITPEGAQSLVTWSMYGKNTVMGKIVGIFINCEKMVGDMYSKGLLNLKATVEK